MNLYWISISNAYNSVGKFQKKIAWQREQETTPTGLWDPCLPHIFVGMVVTNTLPISIGASWKCMKDPSWSSKRDLWSTITFVQSQLVFVLGSADFPNCPKAVRRIHVDYIQLWSVAVCKLPPFNQLLLLLGYKSATSEQNPLRLSRWAGTKGVQHGIPEFYCLFSALADVLDYGCLPSKRDQRRGTLWQSRVYDRAVLRESSAH